MANLKTQLKDVMEKEQKLEVQLRQPRAQLGQIQFPYANVIYYHENTPRPPPQHTHKHTNV